MTIEISRLTPENAKAAAELEAKCFSSPWPYESFIDVLNNKSAGYFAALDGGGRLLGYIGMYDLIDEVSIINIATDPNHRHMGIGKLLICAAEDFARERNCPRITLEVRESNLPAISLYEKQGYLPNGREKNYYNNPKEDALLYYKEI